jgi:hypothetical protein
VLTLYILLLLQQLTRYENGVWEALHCPLLDEVLPSAAGSGLLLNTAGMQVITDQYCDVPDADVLQQVHIKHLTTVRCWMLVTTR